MSSHVGIATRRQAGRGVRRWAGPVAVAALIAAMALDTTVVGIGSEQDVRDAGFSAAAYGEEMFPQVRDAIVAKAAPAPQLVQALAEDEDAAVARHGTVSGIAPVMAVSFSGTVGEGRSGTYEVDVTGLPDDIRVRVQTGPAITGTELRDAPGTIEFGQFTNQIEYQNAGAALNDAMKAQVLAGLDRESLPGRTISVTGAFRLINPKNWLVTPVELSVQ